MSDSALANAASRTADSVESALKGLGEELTDSIGSVVDATIKRGKKVRKQARRFPIVLGVVALIAAVAVLQRKAKAASPIAPPAAIPTSDVDPKPTSKHHA